MIFPWRRSGPANDWLVCCIGRSSDRHYRIAYFRRLANSWGAQIWCHVCGGNQQLQHNHELLAHGIGNDHKRQSVHNRRLDASCKHDKRHRLLRNPRSEHNRSGNSYIRFRCHGNDIYRYGYGRVNNLRACNQQYISGQPTIYPWPCWNGRHGWIRWWWNQSTSWRYWGNGWIANCHWP